jgi:hypothetical protein
MRGHRWYAIPALTALFVCALIAAGCGDDETTSSTEAATTTSTSDASADKIDAAVKSCGTKAQELPEAAGAGLQAACTSVGNSAKQALAQGGEQVDQALSQAADSCKSSVAQLPAGEAQAALTDLCDAISSS